MIVVSDISKKFDKREVLKNVTLKVEKGKIFALVGLNGVGKTTLLKIIVGLLKCDSGTVEIDGYPVHSIEARSKFAFLPEGLGFPENLTGKDFVSYLAGLFGKEPDYDEILEYCSLLKFDKEALKRPIKTYSKGMKQKIALMATFIVKKDYLILDEPFSGLDPSVRVLLKELLLKAKQEGCGILFSTHILSDVEEITDKFAILHQGKILYSGLPADLKKLTGETTLERAFLKCISGA